MRAAAHVDPLNGNRVLHGVGEHARRQGLGRREFDPAPESLRELIFNPEDCEEGRGSLEFCEDVHVTRWGLIPARHGPEQDESFHAKAGAQFGERVVEDAHDSIAVHKTRWSVQSHK